MSNKITSINLSRAALITTSLFTFVMCCFQNGLEILHYTYITFFFILCNAVASFFRDDDGLVSFENDILRSLIVNSVTFVELVAFPFYVSEIILINEIQIGNFMPAALGVLSIFYHLVFERNRTIVSACVYLYATALIGISIAVGNYFALVSALIFVSGELNFMFGKPVNEVPTHIQFSFFIAAFTLTAHMGLGRS